MPGGKPVRVTTKSAVAAVMSPAAFLPMFNVIVTVPLPLASAFETGGTLLAGRSIAVNFGATAAVASVGASVLLSQPTATSARASANQVMPFDLLLTWFRKTSVRG